jgi:hypothetical protein
MTDHTTHQVLTALLDRLPVDVDQGLESVRRSRDGSHDGAVVPVDDGGLHWHANPRDEAPTRRKRIGVAATALAIAIASTVFAVRAFNQPSQQVPVGSPSPVPEHLQAQVVDQIHVGPFPQAIAVGEGGVWVDVPANGPGTAPEIVHIDPSSDRVVARIPVPEGESDIAAGEGSVWVTRDSRTQGQLVLQTLRIDPATDKITATLPDVGGQVAVGEGYLWALASGPGDSTTTTLVKIDPSTGATISSLPLGATATDIVVGGGFVWVTTLPDPQSGTLIQVDAATNQVLHTLKLPFNDSSVFADGTLWAPTCCSNNNVSLVRVDATGATIGEPVEVGDGLPFAGAFGHLLLMSERGELSDLNLATGQVESLVKSDWPAAHERTVLDPTTGTVWVSNYQDTVTRIDVHPDLNAAHGPTSDSSTLTSDRFYLAPHLAGGQGWDSVSSDPIPATQRDGTTAWASTIPISQEDVHLDAAIPPSTIAQLPQDGIVITVEVVPSAFKDDSVPFPYADLSFDLATATRRGPDAEEPPGNYTVLQTENSDAATLVRVYFGSSDPSPELIAKAQAELDTLQLPPTCTTGGPGSYAVSVSSTTASPGDVLTLTGAVPFQREDGSFDESGSGRMVAWWNVDPKDWEYLFAGSPSPSPAVEGQGILELGQAPMDACTFSIPVTVPESAAGGAYPIAVLQEGGGGAALEGSVIVQVTN